jgi:hypothetical protein
VNFPTYDLKQRFMKTTTHYPHEVDEITASGLTPEPCRVVSAPGVKGPGFASWMLKGSISRPSWQPALKNHGNPHHLIVALQMNL